MAEASILTPVTDRSLFSMHPEDWVTQQDSHDELGAYFKDALRLVLPGCFVARDLAVYWVPGQLQFPYAGPDIFVSRNRPREEDPRAWLVYEDGPLELVIEVASEGTRSKEAERRDKTYAVELKVPEHLFVDLYEDKLELSILIGGRYEPVAPDERGILWSPTLGVGFVRLPGERLVRVLTPSREVVPTRREAEARQREAEARQREAEARQHEAEVRQREAEGRQREAEARAEALAAELERLRAAMEGADRKDDDADGGPDGSGP
jgi:Uma2 family endonuclease